MKGIDIAILIGLVFGFYSGYKRGLLVSLFKVFALIIGIIAGFKLIHMASVYLSDYIDNQNMLPVVSFLCVFILAVISTNLIGKGIKSILDMTFLGLFDNILGGLFNTLKWTIGFSFLFWLLQKLNQPNSSITEGTILYPIIIKIAPNLLSLVENITPFLGDVLQYLQY